MSQRLDRTRRIIQQDERGVLTDNEMRSEWLAVWWEAVEAADEEIVEMVRAMLGHRVLDADLISAFAAGASRLAKRMPKGAQDPRVEELRSIVLDHVRRAMRAQDPSVAVDLIIGLSPAWSTPELVQFAADAALPADARLAADIRMLPAAIAVSGAGWAWRKLVLPRIDDDGPGALHLLCAAYSNPLLPDDVRTRLRRSIISHRENAPEDSLCRVVALLSIERRDEQALLLADTLAVREGVSAWTSAVLTVVYCVAGRQDIARHTIVSAASAIEEGSWWTAASHSVLRYIQALDAKPRDVLTLLAMPAHHEHPRAGLATIGALVARCSLMRMRAYLALGDYAWAAREAHAVIRYHGYRRYDLHMQVAGLEFDVRLLDRLSIIPEELREAEAVTAAHSADDDKLTSMLYEGQVFWRDR